MIILASCAQILNAQKHELPCDSLTNGSYIHFTIDSEEIVETACDSLIHLFSLISENDTVRFAVIGIAKNKNPLAKQLAHGRAQLVIDKLIEMGIPSNRLILYTSLHQEPEKGEPRDWPFYPANFTFEIGVYLELNFE